MEGQRVIYLWQTGPFLHAILGSYKIFDLAAVRNVALRQLGFPVQVTFLVAPLDHRVDLFVGPSVQIHRLHTRYVSSHGSVNPGATDTKKAAQVPRRPARECRRFTIDTYLIGRFLEKLAEYLSMFLAVLFFGGRKGYHR